MSASTPTEKFEKAWREHGRGKVPAREYRFHIVRKFRFDFAWPSCKVAVEIDGFMGRHQTVWGFSRDNEKMNLAVLSGWHVLRFDSRQLGSEEKRRACVLQVLEALELYS